MLRWLSDNFELFFLLNSCWIISLLIARIALKGSEVGIKVFINRILHFLVVSGVVVMVSSAVYVTWINRPSKTAAIRQEKTLRISYDVSWVKSKFPVYFIAGKDLGRINADGTDLEYVFEGKYPVREYYFSPGGKYILVATTRDLHLVDIKNGQSKLIDSIGVKKEQEEFKGSVSRVLWAPTGDKFFYRIARWTPYSSQDNCIVFYLADEKKDTLKDPACRVNEHAWGWQGKNLYYSRYSNPQGDVYDIRIYQVPLTTLTPEQIATLQSSNPSLFSNDLEPFGVRLYMPDEKLSFGKNPIRRLRWISEQGKKAGLTEDGFFYLQKPDGEQKRLFFISRNPHTGLVPIRQLRWLPKEDYIIIEHDMFGILVLDPATEQIGQVIHGRSVGWYPPLKNHK